MLLAALLLSTTPSAWVPARWTSSDTASLDLLKPTPVNCLLLEHDKWSKPFAAAAAKQGVAVLGVVRPGPSALDQAREAVNLGLTGVVLEGDFPDRIPRALADSKITTVELSPRAKMRFDASQPIVGTDQGIWPGVEVQKDGQAKSAPSGAPWIDTNTGFLRFVQALTSSTIWIANLPPPNTVIPANRYLQTIGDAAMSGARWVVALDDDLNRRLLARDPKALAAWAQIGQCLQFYEDHPAWRTYQPRSELGIVEGVSSGALLSGGILDMIAVKHTPVRPLPASRVSPDSMNGLTMAADVDPASLTPQQRAALEAFTRSGGTLLNAPPGWKFVLPKNGGIVLDASSLQQLDEIWKELNSLTGRQNLGARLFNVSTMISNLVQAPSGSPVVLHLVNYSDFPVESITVHLLGTFHHARLLMPGQKPIDLQTYPVDEGTGVDIDKMDSVAAVELE
jgi:hypothetical protein